MQIGDIFERDWSGEEINHQDPEYYKIQKAYVQSQASYSVISNEMIRKRQPMFL